MEEPAPARTFRLAFLPTRRFAESPAPDLPRIASGGTPLHVSSRRSWADGSADEPLTYTLRRVPEPGEEHLEIEAFGGSAAPVPDEQESLGPGILEEVAAPLRDQSTLLSELNKLRFAEEQLRVLGSAVQIANEGIAIMTPAVEERGPRIVFVNDGFCRMTGLLREQVIGETPEVLALESGDEHLHERLLDHLFRKLPFRGEAVATRGDGSNYAIELHVVPVAGENGELTHWVAFLRDVSERKAQLLRLEHQALHDTLTDLPNRVLLFDRLEQAIAASPREKAKVALMLMDLDRFKEVNDAFGHQCGDLLLKAVAIRLRQQVRVSDTVARLGGDEFAIVLPTIGDPSTAAQVAQKILKALEAPFIIEDKTLDVGASIGIAICPTHGNDAATLLRRADIAMYRAKSANIGFHFHTMEGEGQMESQLSLAADLRQAIDLDQLVLHYQPKLHLRSGLVTRVEALVRWKHPHIGMISPADFIPLAERTGLVKPLTDWVLDHALHQIQEWQQRGIPMHVAVNLSTRSLQEPFLAEKVQEVLTRYKIEPRCLKLEITESSILADPPQILAILYLLQSLGVRLSIDDFGTGYSSLVHLRNLPVDEIKVDQSFVKGMLSNDADAAIVRATIDLAHNLGHQVAAEGVEDAATFRRLRELGCDLAQGYFLSPPLPAKELEEWLEKTRWGLDFILPQH